MHSLVCVSIACASVCMSVPMCVCKCVYFGACVVGGWIKVWKVESAHHHDALKEERQSKVVSLTLSDFKTYDKNYNNENIVVLT